MRVDACWPAPPSQPAPPWPGWQTHPAARGAAQPHPAPPSPAAGGVGRGTRELLLGRCFNRGYDWLPRTLSFFVLSYLTLFFFLFPDMLLSLTTCFVSLLPHMLYSLSHLHLLSLSLIFFACFFLQPYSCISSLLQHIPYSLTSISSLSHLTFSLSSHIPSPYNQNALASLSFQSFLLYYTQVSSFLSYHTLFSLYGEVRSGCQRCGVWLSHPLLPHTLAVGNSHSFFSLSAHTLIQSVQEGEN